MRRPNIKALRELVDLVEKETGAATTCQDDPDAESVGATGDGAPMAMTFGHVRRARDELDALAAIPNPVTPLLQWGKRTPEGSWLASNDRAGLAEYTAHFEGAIVPVVVEWDANGDCKIEPAVATAAAGAAPIEEADAKAGEHGLVQLPDGWLAIEMKAAEAEIAKWTAGLRASFESLFRTTPAASTIPSEPEAKGEAGAGPVGEAEIIGQTYDGVDVLAPAVPSKNFTPEEARSAVRKAMGRQSPKDDIVRLYDSLTERAETAEAALAESEQNAQGLASDLAGTQAELAETRESLEKLLAAAGKARTALAGFTSVDDAAFALDVAIGDLAEWKREACPSTHTDAGAGPVGEAVACNRDEGWQPIETAPTGGKFGCFLTLAFGPPGDQTVSEGMHFQGRFYAASVFYTGGPHDTKQFTFREHEVKPTHWRPTPAAPGVSRPVEEPGEVERAVAEACKPWEFATGEPPEWGSPLHQVFVAGMTYSERLLAKFLKVQTYEGGDGSEDFDCDATMSLVNIIAAAGLWDKDEHRPAAEDALAETRERLEKRAGAAEARFNAARGLIRDAIGLVPLAHQNWHADARAALSTQESSAALAGDGKERA